MRGIFIQLEVIYALLIREMKTRFGAHRLGYVWALIEPVLWIGTFVVVYYVFGHQPPPGTTLIAFLVTGFVPFDLFRDASAHAMMSISGNKGLLFYPQVRPLDLVIARVLLEAATQLTVFTLLMGGEALYIGQLHVNSLLTTLAGLGLAAGLGAGLGLLFCGLSVFFPTVERLYTPLIRPLFWFSALFYPVDLVPTVARKLLLLNPLVHAIELVRYGWFPSYGARHIDPSYPALWILVMLFFGLSLERVARRRLELS
ncbi:MAG TPA: ABC transporter permease [Polyangiaceae bacterium]|jgi:capsular polysaccharide transport system permease protein